MLLRICIGASLVKRVGVDGCQNVHAPLADDASKLIQWTVKTITHRLGPTEDGPAGEGSSLWRGGPGTKENMQSSLGSTQPHWAGPYSLKCMFSSIAALPWSDLMLRG